MRKLFYRISFISVLIVLLMGWFYAPAFQLFYILVPLIVIGFFDILQARHTILRNFPVIGHLRYIFESISPEIQQYFIERRTDGKPFSRNHRSIVYQRAKEENETHPFGTELDLYQEGYEGLTHSMYPSQVANLPDRVQVGGKDCRRPYDASIFNISAMSFGSISKNAILALGYGAKRGGFYHNTGEGGLSDYHLATGADLVWQIGTGYFGCRTPDGDFDPDAFRQKSRHAHVKMIELKLSQGAKPGHGGVLPAVKNTEEISRVRGLKPHTTVLSPPGHRRFSDGRGLLEFIAELRELSDGKPVGFKFCLGKPQEFESLCEDMRSTGILPDFITVDGAEGGTGAAPIEFSDSVGIPLEPALIFVMQTLQKYDLRRHIRVIASGKIITAYNILKILAMGADMCNNARGFMFSVGCIQALRCNTNKCPTGVATQDPGLVKGLVVEEKKDRVFNYHRNTIKMVMELLAASGQTSLSELSPEVFIRGDEMIDLENSFIPNYLFEKGNK